MSKIFFRVDPYKTVNELSQREHFFKPKEWVESPISELKPISKDGLVADVIKNIGPQEIHPKAPIAAEITITASPDYFKNKESGQGYDQAALNDFKLALTPWIKSNFSHAACVVFNEEKRMDLAPHFKIIDVPLDSEGKLNYFAKYGKEGMLSKWQDGVAEQVAHLGIERGTPKQIAIEGKKLELENKKGEKIKVQETKITQTEKTFAGPQPVRPPLPPQPSRTKSNGWSR